MKCTKCNTMFPKYSISTLMSVGDGHTTFTDSKPVMLCKQRIKKTWWMFTWHNNCNNILK